MIQERLNQRIEALATQTGCSPEAHMVELTRLAEIGIAEGNRVYGKDNLKGIIETRVKQRAAMLNSIEVIHQRQQEQLQRLEEARITLSSALVLLRKQLGIPMDLAPAPTPTDLGQRSGYIRNDGTARAADPKEKKPDLDHDHTPEAGEETVEELDFEEEVIAPDDGPEESLSR